MTHKTMRIGGRLVEVPMVKPKPLQKSKRDYVMEMVIDSIHWFMQFSNRVNGVSNNAN